MSQLIAGGTLGLAVVAAMPWAFERGMRGFGPTQFSVREIGGVCCSEVCRASPRRRLRCFGAIIGTSMPEASVKNRGSRFKGPDPPFALLPLAPIVPSFMLRP